ncbi:hypothetical protein QAD02_024408 [Eretmocerus hayati]|uniref:Uncharacterized protein n=1 Tax=Eretmocerus hayati TaxID=131215 RepID=A0ACC2PYN8_9HYME|nr:hypothetical protein QAD02_024408 [Eretmocerus hayati]
MEDEEPDETNGCPEQDQAPAADSPGTNNDPGAASKKTPLSKISSEKITSSSENEVEEIPKDDEDATVTASGVAPVSPSSGSAPVAAATDQMAPQTSSLYVTAHAEGSEQEFPDGRNRQPPAGDGQVDGVAPDDVAVVSEPVGARREGRRLGRVRRGLEVAGVPVLDLGVARGERREGSPLPELPDRVEAGRAKDTHPGGVQEHRDSPQRGEPVQGGGAERPVCRHGPEQTGTLESAPAQQLHIAHESGGQR